MGPPWNIQGFRSVWMRLSFDSVDWKANVPILSYLIADNSKWQQQGVINCPSLSTLLFEPYSYIVFRTMMQQQKRSTASFFCAPLLTNISGVILCSFIQFLKASKKMQTQQNHESDFRISTCWAKLKDSRPFKEVPPAQILHSQKCCPVVIPLCSFSGCFCQTRWSLKVTCQLWFWRKENKEKCNQNHCWKHRDSTEVAHTWCSTSQPPKFLNSECCPHRGSMQTTPQLHSKHFQAGRPWYDALTALARTIATFIPRRQQMKCLLILFYFS